MHPTAILRFSIRLGLVSALVLAHHARASVQLDIPPRQQWDDNDGYCGEVSIQSIALYFGAYISQYRARAIIDPTQQQDALVPTHTGTILDALRLGYTNWNSNSAQPQYQAYLVWAKSHLALGHPVIITAYIKGLGDPDYDHIMAATGFTSTDTTTYHATDTLVFNDNYAATPFTRTFGSLFDTRAMTGNGALYTYCIPRNIDYGCAVTGIKDDSGTVRPVTLRVDKWNEPNLLHSAAPVQMNATIEIRNLTPDDVYVLLRYDTYQSVPTNNYLASPHDAATYFVARTGTHTLTDTFQSDATVLYRCVPSGLVMPVVTALDLDASLVSLRFTTRSGQTYYVQTCDDLNTATWTTVATNISGTGGVVTFTESRPPGALHHFYRVGLVTP